MKPSEKSVLYRTSAATDVRNSGGVLSITGLNPVNKNVLKSILQVKYKAEVPQVVTIGAVDTAWTPAASTKYSIEVWDRNRTVSGWKETQKIYSYTTSSDLSVEGGTAALRREYINGKIITAINADGSNHAVAATLTLGNGFTVTDDGGYYPAHSQGQTNTQFVNEVKIISGYATTNLAVTTAGVTSSGVGATLATFAPVMDFMTGNLVSGTLTAPPLTVQASGGAPGLPAVSGQNYDAFVVLSLHETAAHGEANNKLCYINEIQTVWVDNGTGSATTNLTGFLAFERAMRKEVGNIFEKDNDSWIDFLDSPMLFQGAAGAVPATTGESKIATDYGQWVYNNIGTNTITVPTPSNSGLLLDQDLTDTEGAEHTPSLLTNNSQFFVVGKEECSITVKLTAADHTDAGFMAGFRIKAAHAADFNNYTDLGAIGFLGDLVYTWGILNNAATVATNTTIVPADASVEEYVVKIAINGAVTVSRNGVTYPVYSVGTTALILDAGDSIIPFVRAVNISAGDPDVIVSQIIAVADKNWLS
jgi:hypothetical protein